jgi:23S rRNA (guanosine2251-2'-O)-methyltransferase
LSDYQAKKQKFDDMITLYGRKPVQEVLRDPSVRVYKLHLAETNRTSDVIAEIRSLAESRDIDIQMHTREALSRISKNGRQDQGVAIDIQPMHYGHINGLPEDVTELIVVDGVTNPQNLGMIIRSVTASPVHGLLIPKKGSAKIDPLVHKASAGTLLKGNLYHAPTIESGLEALKTKGFTLIGLAGSSENLLKDIPGSSKIAFVVGNETEGLSESALKRCDQLVRIPLANEVESINVAMAATLVSFRSLLT